MFFCGLLSLQTYKCEHKRYRNPDKRQVSGALDFCGGGENCRNEPEEPADNHACVPERFLDFELFVRDDGDCERGDDARRVNGIGHCQKPDDIFTLERKVGGDNADDNDGNAHDGNAARVQNVAPENGGGIDEACVC